MYTVVVMWMLRHLLLLLSLDFLCDGFTQFTLSRVAEGEVVLRTAEMLTLEKLFVALKVLFTLIMNVVCARSTSDCLI